MVNKIEQESLNNRKCIDIHCKGKVMFHTLQTRSGDEEKLIYFQCDLCEKTLIKKNQLF